MIYWSTYKNIESEVQKLADSIHVNDTQISVYSYRIGDLIVRTLVEVESISKDLYYQNEVKKLLRGDRKEHFDSKCLKFLDERWKLSKKEISITGSDFFFRDNGINKTITPFHVKTWNFGEEKNEWLSAYQAIKHDKRKSLEVSTFKNLLHALGALYILNLYFRDQKIELGRDYNPEKIDSRFGSSIFSIKVSSNTPFEKDYNNSNIMDSFIYLVEAQIDIQKLESKIDNFHQTEVISIELGTIPHIILDRTKESIDSLPNEKLNSLGIKLKDIFEDIPITDSNVSYDKFKSLAEEINAIQFKAVLNKLP